MTTPFHLNFVDDNNLNLHVRMLTFVYDNISFKKLYMDGLSFR